MIQTRIALLLSLLLVSPAAVARPQDQEPFPSATPASQGMSAQALAQLAEEVGDLVAQDRIVGAELIVIQSRRTVLHETFGHSDRDKDREWTRDTVCNIRSMTKPLTGAAAQLLVDRGQLDLDDPVAKYLPGFDSDQARAISVRQVITHRAGLPLTVLTRMDEFECLLDIGNAVGARGPEFEPDSRFWYSDGGSEVLGAIVEVASGLPLDQFVHEELLVPLGMADSFYFLDDEDPRRSRIASLYVGGQKNWIRFLDAEEGAFYPFAWGSQSIYSTPKDYARFLAMWMDQGRVGERVLLTKAAVERTLTPASEMSMMGSETRFPTSFQGLEVFYGQMAVLHVPIAAAGAGPATIVGHSGSDGTIAWAWPERDLMILCFTQSRGSGAVLRVEEMIDRLLITPEAYAQSEVPDELRPLLGTYVADWANHMKEEFVVQYKGDKLSVDIPSQLVLELVPTEEEGKWTFAIAPQIKIWFESSDEGEIDCLRIQQGPLTFEAPRKGTPHEREVADANRPDPVALGKLLGKYHDSEEDEDVEVFIDGDYVAVSAKEFVFHLWKVPVADVWQVRENPLMSITFQEQEGKVVSFTRTGPGAATQVFPRVEDGD